MATMWHKNGQTPCYVNGVKLVTAVAMNIRPVIDHTVSNQQILLVAIRRLGGRLHLVNVEDIAVEAAAIVPGRFNWPRYSANIDLEKVRASIRFLGRGKGDESVIGGTKEGWMLTSMGLAETDRLCSILPDVVPAIEAEMLHAERARLASHEILSHLDGPLPPREMICDFLRPPSASGRVFARTALTKFVNSAPHPENVMRAFALFSKHL